MSPRQVAQNLMAVLRESWQTVLILAAIVTVSVTGLRKMDALMAVADQNADNLRTVVQRLDRLSIEQDSVFRWRASINALFCSSIYPQRAQQAVLLGLCGLVVPIAPFSNPPRTVRPR